MKEATQGYKQSTNNCGFALLRSVKISPRSWIAALLLGISSSIYAGGTMACGGAMEVTLDGKTSKAENLTLVMDLQALIESCSVDSTAYAASEEKWKEQLAASGFLHFTLPEGMQFSTKLYSGESVEIAEVILPLPIGFKKSGGSYPDHIYLKNKRGYQACTKYDPKILRKIVSAPEVNLISEAPYSNLKSLP